MATSQVVILQHKKKFKISIADIIIYSILAIIAFISLYPLIYTLACSLNDAQDLIYGGVWFFPREFTTASYVVVLQDQKMYTALFNTALSTVVVLVLALLLTSCVAYALASQNLVGKKFFWYANLVSMFISGGMIPTYMVMILLGLYDSFLVYIIPSLYSVFNMIILCNFFRSIDKSLYESAIIDGAGEWRIWFTIYLPLSKPALATVGLWIFVAKWNSYLPTMLYTAKDESIWLLQYYLMRLIREGEVPSTDSMYFGQVSATTLSFAAIIISSIPILCLYPFITRFFAKGIMLGSLKG